MFNLTKQKVWLWNNGKDPGSWYFVSLPKDLAEEIHLGYSEYKIRGMIRVSARIGDTEWQTSLFTDNENDTFLLPLKKSVRQAEGIDDGDTIDLQLEVVPYS